MSSPESFHSVGSQNYSSGRQSITSDQQPQSSTLPGLLQQEPTNQISEDVEAWLACPENLALLEGLTKHSVPQQSSTSLPQPPRSAGLPVTREDVYQDHAASPQEPSQLLSSSRKIAEFYMACQKRGVTPIFDIVEISLQRFGGTLKIAGQSISLESEALPSKRDVKGVLAAKGLAALKSLKSFKFPEETNWVGRLGEYLITLPGSPEATYTHTANKSKNPANPKYVCEVELSLPLNGTTILLSFISPRPLVSKKAAKSAAAKEAVKHLIVRGELSPDGRVAKKNKLFAGLRKPEPLDSAGLKKANLDAPDQSDPTTNVAIWSTSSSTAISPKGQTQTGSYTSRVNAIYPTLGLSSPDYRIQPADGAKGLYSGAAYFPGTIFGPSDGCDGLPGGPIGEVRHIHGKKKAKEECAKGVLAYLEEVIEQRKSSV